jgi:hypothetical protein
VRPGRWKVVTFVQGPEILPVAVVYHDRQPHSLVLVIIEENRIGAARAETRRTT